MIMEKVLAAAKPQLAGKAVKDLVVGISLVGCELDSGEVGVSYVLREDLPAGCSAFPYTQEAIGSPAEEIAGWIVAGKKYTAAFHCLGGAGGSRLRAGTAR